MDREQSPLLPGPRRGPRSSSSTSSELSLATTASASTTRAERRRSTSSGRGRAQSRGNNNREQRHRSGSRPDRRNRRDIGHSRSRSRSQRDGRIVAIPRRVRGDRNRSNSPVVRRGRQRSSHEEGHVSNLTISQLVEALQVIKNCNTHCLPNSSMQNVVPEFDPSRQEQTVVTWLHKVNECAKIYSWNDTQKIHFALPKLRGVAQKWYEGLDTLMFSWYEWQEKLKSAFPSDENYGQLLTTMVAKRARFGESLEDYFYEKVLLLHRCGISALHDETVWGGGLFVFYHIFAFLEDAKERLNDPDFNKLFVHTILYRKQSFQEDLDHYLGKDWRSLPKSIPLESYLQHLQDLEVDSPQLLMAYVYHLYLGLLSGGQILAKKRRMFGDKNDEPDAYVDKVTDFSEIDISQLKNDFRAAMNEIADNMSEKEKNAFIEESSMVFWMNNLAVNAIGGQNRVLKSYLYKASAILVLVFGAVLAYKMR